MKFVLTKLCTSHRTNLINSEYSNLPIISKLMVDPVPRLFPIYTASKREFLVGRIKAIVNGFLRFMTKQKSHPEMLCNFSEQKVARSFEVFAHSPSISKSRAKMSIPIGWTR